MALGLPSRKTPKFARVQVARKFSLSWPVCLVPILLHSHYVTRNGNATKTCQLKQEKEIHERMSESVNKRATTTTWQFDTITQKAKNLNPKQLLSMTFCLQFCVSIQVGVFQVASCKFQTESCKKQAIEATKQAGQNRLLFAPFAVYI